MLGLHGGPPVIPALKGRDRSPSASCLPSLATLGSFRLHFRPCLIKQGGELLRINLTAASTLHLRVHTPLYMQKHAYTEQKIRQTLPQKKNSTPLGPPLTLFSSQTCQSPKLPWPPHLLQTPATGSQVLRSQQAPAAYKPPDLVDPLRCSCACCMSKDLSLHYYP